MPNHAHPQMRFPTATGGSTGFTVDTSMSGTPAAANNTGDPVGGVASVPHTGMAVGAHSDHAALTHSVGQANDHAAQAHSAHDEVSNLPPYVVAYVWLRTA